MKAAIGSTGTDEASLADATDIPDLAAVLAAPGEMTIGQFARLARALHVHPSDLLAGVA